MWLNVAQPWASECPDVKNYKWWLNPAWHRMLYSCTHVATLGVKGLMVAGRHSGWILRNSITIYFHQQMTIDCINCGHSTLEHYTKTLLLLFVLLQISEISGIPVEDICIAKVTLWSLRYFLVLWRLYLVSFVRTNITYSKILYFMAITWAIYLDLICNVYNTMKFLNQATHSEVHGQT